MHKDTLIHRTLQTHKSVHIHAGRHKHTQYAHIHACEHTECMCIYSSACVGVRIYIGEFINKTVHTSNSIYVCVYTYTNTVDTFSEAPSLASHSHSDLLGACVTLGRYRLSAGFIMCKMRPVVTFMSWIVVRMQ